MTKKEDMMFPLVESWRESGKTRKEFYDEHHMKVSTFAYWVTRKNKAAGSGRGFLPKAVFSGAFKTKINCPCHFLSKLFVD